MLASDGRPRTTIERAMQHAYDVLPAVAAHCVCLSLLTVMHTPDDPDVRTFVGRVLDIECPECYATGSRPHRLDCSRARAGANYGRVVEADAWSAVRGTRD